MAIEDLNNKTDGIHDNLLSQIDLQYIVRSPMNTFSLGAIDAVEMSHVKACIGPHSYEALKGILLYAISLYLISSRSHSHIPRGEDSCRRVS
jgi:hypothetical protein